MQQKPILFKAIIFIILILLGVIAVSVVGICILLATGMSFSEIQNDPSALQNLENANLLRLALFMNQFLLFLLPSLFFGWFFYRKDMMKQFMLNRIPSIFHIILGIALLIAAYPLVNAAFMLNSKIPLADWMITTEQDVAATLNRILNTDSMFGKIANILLIAVTPAIAEELVFRGIIQRYAEKLLRNGHIAVWVSATIFSLIHFQFEGFLARIVLGAVLGYAFYWTRNLWVPICIHFINNLVPILALVFIDEDITDTANIESSFQAIWLIPSVIGVLFVRYLFLKTKNKKLAGQEL